MPYKDPLVRKMYNDKRYQEKKHLWKNEDGTWKNPGTSQAKKDRFAERYRADPIFRAQFQGAAKARRVARRIFGTCPICKRVPAEYGNIAEGQLVRDHCHRTNRVREWICMTCNLGLGHAMDSPKILRAMIEYLLKHGVNDEK